MSKIPKMYELVILSAYDTMSLHTTILPKLDPHQQFIQYIYGFEAFGRNTPKSSFKSLNCLNRDIKNILCVDFELSSIEGYEENSIIIPEFKGDDVNSNNDQILYNLTLFLE